MNSLIYKIKEVGIINFIIGLIIYIRNYIFMKKFNYDNWHLSTMYLRPYLKYVRNYLNENKEKKVLVDIGCGNGELLRSIVNVKGYGFDLSKEVIKYANFLNKNQNISFNVGTLSNIKINDKRINYLILLNWTHSMEFDDFSKELNIFLNKHDVKNIIIDYVHDYTNHSIELITNNEYILFSKQIGFLREREILFYKKVNQ